MKKDVKIVSFILAVLIIFSLSACNTAKNNTSSVVTSIDSSPSSLESTLSSEESDISSEESSSADESIPETEATESVSSEEPISTEPVSSEAPVSSIPEVSSEVPTASVPAVAPVTPSTPSVASPYTVNDPENTRGLSETRMGYGHGQQVSKDNQTRFNSMAGVEALAIDTVTGTNSVYLTFDCGYEYNNLTASILDTLKAKNVKAVFFCTLSYIKNNPQLVSRMINEGHIVGNHSATHPVFPTITRTQMADEIYQVHKYLQENYNYTPKYFRFPTGSYSESSLELVTSVGYKSIFWSFAYKDWETANQPEPTAALETIKGAFYPGSVLLLHAVSQTNTTLLPEIIDYGISQGYTFATLDDYYN